MAEMRQKLVPDEMVKAVYRATRRELRNRQTSGGVHAELQAQLEFLERVYSF
jgi:hypothetical protein